MTILRLSVCSLLIASGCGLISSDVTNFDLTLPDKTFSVDTASWQVNSSMASSLLMMSCASAPALCGTAAAQACAMGCSGSCDATTQTCDLALDVAIHQGVDLVMEKPELKTINDQPVIKVTIDSVTYEVTTNTLNVDTPPMNVMIAPVSITDPNDPMAKQIGTIDAVPKMSIVAPKTLTFSPGGQQALIDIMSTFKTPFNVIVGAQLIVNGTSPIPTGKLDAVVHIKAHAGV